MQKGIIICTDQETSNRINSDKRKEKSSHGRTSQLRGLLRQSLQDEIRASFPRTLGKYVREEKVGPLHEMIRKMTSMPARVYGLKGKGLIWEGMDADICIFNENEIMDQADYTDPMKRAKGLSYVILGGEVVVEDAVFNGTKNGKLYFA